MKMKLWLPRFMIVAGIVVLGIGIWEITNVNIKTKETLNKAKQVIGIQTGIQQKTEGKVGHEPAGIGDTIGILEIPTIKAELAIVEGTDPDDLEKGVGHYKGSSLPGEHGQIVLSGHRDTVFHRLGELKIGDGLIIQVPKGFYKYKITSTKIVDAKDKSIITLQKQDEELILTTCYPFRYIGNAPKRYIIYAKPS